MICLCYFAVIYWNKTVYMYLLGSLSQMSQSICQWKTFSNFSYYIFFFICLFMSIMNFVTRHLLFSLKSCNLKKEIIRNNFMPVCLISSLSFWRDKAILLVTNCKSYVLCLISLCIWCCDAKPSPLRKIVKS